MIKDYKSKLEGKATANILDKFAGFDSQANFIKIQEKMNKK